MSRHASFYEFNASSPIGRLARIEFRTVGRNLHPATVGYAE